VPISFGARLSGSIDKNWRIGLMDMRTKKVEETGLPAQNFTVLALQRRLFARSGVRLLFINKQSLHYQPGQDSGKAIYSLYNRNIGAEYNLASSNNRWTGKFMMLKSFAPGKNSNSLSHGANLQYFSRRWLLSWQQEYVSKQFTAETGYVPRNNYIKLSPLAGYLFFPAKGRVLSHGPRYTGNFFYTPSFRKTDYGHTLLYLFNLRDQTSFDVWGGKEYVELLLPFDPTNSNKDSLAAGTMHHWKTWGVDYFSSPQNLFTYSIATRFGGYYLGGTRQSVTADIGYRFQPYVGITLSSSYNRIKMPAPWKETTLWLIGPRVDVTFTNKVFFTTFLQYNNQQKNIKLNTRFQWRYRPASDLFLVYTDNYYSSPFYIRNRAFVLKFTYWWNN
jgi:hypothetical protein